jgi:ligand-binding sensor domain-containing protein
VNGELAILNFTAGQPLHILDLKNNSWQSYSASFPSSRATQIIDMGNGTYWMRIAPTSGGGIKIYDTINQRELYLTSDNNSGGLPDTKVYDMALDREGKMWIATEKGVIFYYNAAYILDNGPIDPVSPIYDGQILFKGDKVSALAIDGGNRIWMGTASGLWLFANDGQKIISHYTAEDSPLPTNDILDIAINQTSGEVFVATTNGMVSYRGSATVIGMQEEVKIFPNPVITSQHDIVTFEGVPENASLTISDSSGRLIFKTKANGNTAIWQWLSSYQ